ncbi:MAG: hypothetical protein WC981_03590 [Candidatus Dojkabacteria bacterium]
MGVQDYEGKVMTLLQNTPAFRGFSLVGLMSSKHTLGDNVIPGNSQVRILCTNDASDKYLVSDMRTLYAWVSPEDLEID